MTDRQASSGRGGNGDDWRLQLDADTHNTTAFDADPSSNRLLIPGLTVLWHPDLKRVGERVALPELLSSRTVLLSRVSPEFAAPGKSDPRPLADSHVSRTPIQLIGNGGDAVLIDRGEHRGRVSVDGVGLEQQREIKASQLHDGSIIVISAYVALLLHWLDPAPTALPSFGLVGESSAMGRLRREIKRVTRLEVPILLRGETGTGKELVAQAIHEAGPRSAQECVTVNMAAIPPSLAASELFGSTKGAFTGADRHKVGFFQQADRGTLFLDEVGETPPDIQALLLRALESQEIQPVGAVSTRRVDIRVIAATDADLDSAVASGEFRAPLLHRLAGYEIRIPTLRQRRDDIARLLVHFLARELESLSLTDGRQTALDLPLKLMIDLVGYAWPGNVRQLLNVARRLAILSEDETHDLRAGIEEVLGESLSKSQAKTQAADSQTSDPSGIGDHGSAGSQTTPPRRTYRKPSDVSEEELIGTLRDHGWQLKTAAESLGVSRASLYLMIEACDRIRKAVDLKPEEIERVRVEENGDIERMARRLEVSVQGLKRRVTQLDKPG